MRWIDPVCHRDDRRPELRLGPVHHAARGGAPPTPGISTSRLEPRTTIEAAAGFLRIRERASRHALPASWPKLYCQGSDGRRGDLRVGACSRAGLPVPERPRVRSTLRVQKQRTPNYSRTTEFRQPARSRPECWDVRRRSDGSHAARRDEVSVINRIGFTDPALFGAYVAANPPTQTTDIGPHCIDWVVEILPYLDAINLYNDFNRDRSYSGKRATWR